MKRMAITAAVAICVWACNEPASTGTPATDTLHNDNINNTDVNNRNMTKYDSVGNSQTDTTIQDIKDRQKP